MSLPKKIQESVCTVFFQESVCDVLGYTCTCIYFLLLCQIIALGKRQEAKRVGKKGGGCGPGGVVRGVVREVCEGRCEETLRMAVSPECIDFYML